MSVAMTHPARYSILTVDLPREAVEAGVLLEDPATNRLYVRLRRDWDRIAPRKRRILSH